MSLTIGKLAKAASINIETVRYYERRGLIEQPARPDNGFRKYPRETLDRIIFIKRAQELGFTLKEVLNLLAISDGNCQQVQALAESKLTTIQQKITDLQRLEMVLNQLLQECTANRDKNHCPIVHSLIEQKD